MSNDTNDGQRLAHLPVSIFSTVMGLSGFAIAWQKAHAALAAPALIWQLLAGFATTVFIALLALYGLKLLRHFPEVAKEWNHPVRVSFFPTISISLLLLAVVWLELAPQVTFLLLIIGVVVHLTFTLAILTSWVFHTHYDIKHANPAWFIPVVGNLFVPIVAAHFGLTEFAWFFFSIGIVFWLVMMTIVIYRVVFHDPIPPKLLPTLFILIAPPAVGFIAYCAMTPGLDVLARLLYYTGLFMTLLLGGAASRFVKNGFFISSWAYSFPLAAITIATFLMGKRSCMAFFDNLAFALLAILSTVIVILVVKTLGAVRRKAICTPE